jgi:alpha-1,6-mannosyltransferase
LHGARVEPQGGATRLVGGAARAATLTKFFPLVIASALYRRWDWKMPLAFFAVMVGLYGFYAWFGGGGWHIFGSLPGYVSDEGFESGRGVFILTILRAVGLPRLPATLGFLAIAFAVMGTLFLRALSRDRPDHSMPVLAAAFAAAAVVLISPHYPWYFVWITAFNCLVPRLSLIYLTCAPFFLYVTESSTSLTTGFVLYGPFLILLPFELRRLVAPLIQEGSTS